MNAKHVPMTNDEYHAHPAWGASMIEEFRDNRPLCRARHVDKTMPQRTPTPAMNIGSLVHIKLLEPERWESVVAPPFPETAPDGKKWLRRKGSEHEKWWQEEVDKRAGMIAVGEDDLAIVNSVVQAVRNNWHARRLIEGDGQAEYTILWTDKATGIDCKCRVDWFASISLDLKTACDVSPQGYARSLVNLGYHRKRAHYIAGLQALLDEKDPPFVHLAAETSEPFRVACYDIDDRDMNGLSLGVDQRRSTLYQIARCMESGDWRDPFEKQVCTLSLPRFAWTESEYTYAG